jgi:hypothetical protein
MRNDALVSALLGHTKPTDAESVTTLIPPEGGYRTERTIPKNPAAEHSQALGAMLATRRLDSDARRSR